MSLDKVLDRLELQYSNKYNCANNKLVVLNLIKAIREMKGALRNISCNYDCDSDAHKYNGVCRACDAESTLAKVDGMFDEWK